MALGMAGGKPLLYVILERGCHERDPDRIADEPLHKGAVVASQLLWLKLLRRGEAGG